jgi:hypothetical protein
MKRTPIFILLRPSSPAAISWLIVPIIVWIAVNLILRRRSSPHIHEEIPEISPASADFNSATSPIPPFWIIWIGATLHHSSPNHVLSGSFRPRVFSMLKIPISMVASTATRGMASIFPLEIIPEKHFFSTAIAKTQPARAALSHLRNAAKNKKPIESLARNINQRSCHAVIIPLPALIGAL